MKYLFLEFNYRCLSPEVVLLSACALDWDTDVDSRLCAAELSGSVRFGVNRRSFARNFTILLFLTVPSPSAVGNVGILLFFEWASLGDQRRLVLGFSVTPNVFLEYASNF
jgi:hypothetical protein